jgi:hypothetical protein
MLDSLEGVFGFLDRLATQFTWRRLVILLLVFSMVFLAFWIWESYTATFRLVRMERELRLVEEIVALAGDPGLQRDQELVRVVDHLRAQLATLVVGDRAATPIGPSLFKPLTAALPWIFVGVVMLTGRRKRGVAPSTFLGLLVLAVPYIILGTLLPSCEQAWINYWLYPWGSLLLTVFLIRLAQQAKKRRARPAIPAK